MVIPGEVKTKTFCHQYMLNITCLNEIYAILMLHYEKLSVLMSLCIIACLEALKFQLIVHMMILVAWKQSYTNFLYISGSKFISKLIKLIDAKIKYIMLMKRIIFSP